MVIKILFKFKPEKETLIAFGLFFACIGVATLASMFTETPLFVLFYQGVLVLGICIFFPLWYIGIRNKQSLSTIGLTMEGWEKALLVGLIFVIFSVPWRIVGKDLPLPATDALIYTSIALVMSTLFEEVFFRGFLQTRFEKAFGIFPAIVLSGLTFSLYHLVYPAYRDFNLLMILFFVGMFFAVAFRVTSNVITSFTLNLPHAIVTFVEKQTFFDARIAMIAFATTMIAVALIIWAGRKCR